MRHFYSKTRFLILLISLALPTFAHALVTRYIFSQSNGAYVPVAGLGVVVLGAPASVTNYNDLPIGFNFEFNHVVYTRFSVNSTGFISMGSSVVNATNPIKDQLSSNSVISALGGIDVKASTSGAGGELSYQLSGTTPNQILTVQWRSFAINTTSDNFNFQIKLHETSNAVEIVYGAFAYSSTGNSLPLVGLRGNNNLEFSTRKTTTDWSATTVSTTNTDYCLLSASIFPINGLTFTWTPPAPGAMTYVSSDVTTVSTALITKPSADNQMIRVQVNTDGGVAPAFNLAALNINAWGSTTYGSADFSNDVSAIKVYYTGGSNNFSTSNLFGSASSLAAPITGDVTLLEGANFFWVTYDAPVTATLGNYLDAECATITMTGGIGTKTPDIVNPVGNRKIAYCNSGAGNPSYGADIGNVTFGSLSNGSASPSFDNSTATNGYSNFYGKPTVTFLKGENYPIAISLIYSSTHLTAINNTVYAFIDYNQDGIFNTTDEKVFQSAITSGETSGTVTIPTTAVTGMTGLRIMTIGPFANSYPCGLYHNGETEDYIINIQPSPPPCTFPLEAGNAIVNKDSLCAGTNFILGLRNQSTGSDQTYQWESSADGITWATIQGANTLYYTTSQTTNTYYRALVTCGTVTVPSSEIYVTTAFLNCYCTSNGTTAGVAGISKVTFGLLSNNSTASLYSNYSYSLPTLSYSKGISYPVGISTTTFGGAGVSAWANVFIDYNQDGVLDPNSERVFNSSIFYNGSTTPGIASGSISIPSSAKSGATLMRVIYTHGGTASQSPCGTYSKGETEDYKIYIVPHSDIGVTQLVAPVVNDCFGAGNKAEVIFRIQNFDTTPIDFSLKPAKLSASVSGPNPVTFTPFVLNLGTLAAGASQDVTLSTSYDMGVQGNYVFNATITTAEDANTGNDMLSPAASITVSAANVNEDAGFSYSATAYCNGGANPSAQLTGTLGGTFTATPAGLVINASTGEINLAASALSTYTITYKTSGNCYATATQRVTITNQPDASFIYSQSTYCQDARTIPPVFGTKGIAGAFSSSVGLSMDENTGQINLAASIPGTYRVKNSVPAASGCPAAEATTDITIIEAQVATFTYPENPYCQISNVTNPSPVYLRGGIAGTFASSTGLVIDANTGEVDLQASKPGTYTVSNTITASADCPATVAYTGITITDPHNCPDDPEITNLFDIINTYGKVTSIGCDRVTLSSSEGFYAGDKVLLIQMKGAVIDQTNSSTYGTVLDYKDAGNYEFARIVVVSGNEIQLENELLKTYDANGIVQLVRVPEYRKANVRANVSNPLTCSIWNGETGGIVVFEADEVELSGTINVSGKGFRGGQDGSIANNTGCQAVLNYVYSANTQWAGQKGEGIVNSSFGISALCGRGAWANGGGGGNFMVSGGGGGGNLGAGGTGGEQNSNCGPAGTEGVGGRGLTYSNTANKLFLGGGGGSGHQYSTFGNTAGVSGGGMVIVRSGVIQGNGGTIVANGASNSYNTEGDGGGGGGAGGNIVLEAPSIDAVVLSANGGNTANIREFDPPRNSGYPGPGGGGAGGVVWTSSLPTASTITTNGGLSGARTDNLADHRGAQAGQDGGTLTGLVIPENTLPHHAEFSYPLSVYCQAGVDPLPVITGRPGGSFTATPTGLIINTASGEVDLSASALGTYGITYTVGAGCGKVAAKTILFTIANPSEPIFSYTGTPYCESGANPSPTLTSGSAGGTFTSTAGLSMSAGTGIVDLNSSIPGTYTVTYTVNTGGSCPTVSGTTTITISSLPNPNFTYAKTAYCPDAGNPSPVFNGNAVAGTFTSLPAGLSIHAGTGVVNLTTSAAGTYTITNTIAATGGCAKQEHSENLTIDSEADATFTYTSGNTYCQSGADPTPVIDGAPGGTFSAPPGIIIDPVTGSIDLSASSLGTYAVTYSVAGTCPGNKTQNITITDAPDASFSYTGNPWCHDAPDPSPSFPAGSSAGIFSANPSGLVFISKSTGKIDLSASVPGTYTITNTIPVSGGCATVNHNESVAIRSVQSALFDYGNTTFCISGSDPIPSINGTPGGTFSSTPVGLSMNSSTGKIALTASAKKTYTVRYTTPGPCPDSRTVEITITDGPSALFNYNKVAACPSDAPVAPILATGSTAGTFMVRPVGLSMNSAGQIDPANSAPGSYTVTNTITASGTCAAVSHDQQFTIKQTPRVNAVANQIICSGTQTSINLSSDIAGSTFTYSPTSGSAIGGASSGTGTTIAQTLTNSSNTAQTVTYTITTSKDGCTSPSKTATITINPIPVLSIDPQTSSICSGEQTAISLSSSVANSTIDWTANADPNLNGSSDGAGSSIVQALSNTTIQPLTVAYTITAKANNCTSNSKTAEVSVKPLPVLTTSPSNTAGNPDTTVCINTLASLSAIGADSYTWTPTNLLQQTSGSSVQTIPLAEGLYDFTVTGTKDGCQNSKSLQVMALSQIPAPEVSGNQHICKGEGVELTAKSSVSPARFYWYKDAGLSEIIIDQATLKTGPLFTKDTTFYTNIYYGDCASGLKNFYINIRTLPQITISGPLTLCEEESLALVGGGGERYRWYDRQGDTVSTTAGLSIVPQETKYYLLVLDSACRSIDSVSLQINPLPDVDPGPSVGVCLGAQQKIGSPAQAGLKYEWQPSTQLTRVDLAQPGFKATKVGFITYTLTATDLSTSCKQSKVLQTEVYPLPSPKIEVPEAYAADPCAGTKLTLSASGGIDGNDRYDWSSETGFSAQGEQAIIELGKEESRYSLLITTGNGCKKQAEVTLKGEDCQDLGVHVPGVFTPNEDQQNDHLEIVYGAGIAQAQLKIFDRWGGLIYQGNKNSKAWDGSSGSFLLPDGVYPYVLELRTQAGNTFIKQGIVTLSR